MHFCEELLLGEANIAIQSPTLLRFMQVLRAQAGLPRDRTDMPHFTAPDHFCVYRTSAKSSLVLVAVLGGILVSVPIVLATLRRDGFHFDQRKVAIAVLTRFQPRRVFTRNPK
jgi:hypothetical protein